MAHGVEHDGEIPFPDERGEEREEFCRVPLIERLLKHEDLVDKRIVDENAGEFVADKNSQTGGRKFPAEGAQDRGGEKEITHHVMLPDDEYPFHAREIDVARIERRPADECFQGPDKGALHERQASIPQVVK